MYKITTSSYSESVSTGNGVKSLLKLPEIQLGTSTAPVYPVSYSTKIAASSSEVLDLAAKGYTKVRLLVVRSTRPITIVLGLSGGNLVLPKSTFIQHVLDTKESGAGDVILTVEFQVPAAPITTPSPRPEAYPAALVDVFAACEEG